MPKFTNDQMVAMMQAHVEQATKAAAEYQKTRIWIPDDQFCFLSLRDWLKHCQFKKIAHVPADFVAEVAIKSIFDAIDGKRSPDFDQFYNQYKAHRDQHQEWVYRYDCCAFIHTKVGMSEHGQVPPAARGFCLDDPRAIDILYEYPRHNVGLLARPWVKAMYHQGWPIEFRVFVRDGRVQGISNYYPQIALPEWCRATAITAGMLTEKLEAPAPDFTADWLAAEDGSLIFLEGGPPHTPSWGAHPCCFRPMTIDGIALSDRN